MNFDKLLQELENIINLEKFENKKMYLVCLADFITSVFIGSKSYIDKYEYLKIRFNKIRDELLETARNSNKSKKEKVVGDKFALILFLFYIFNSANTLSTSLSPFYLNVCFPL